MPSRRKSGVTYALTLSVVVIIGFGLFVVLSNPAFVGTLINITSFYSKGDAWGTDVEKDFFVGISTGDLAKVKGGLDAGVSPNSDKAGGMPPLYLAAMKNKPVVMRLLIESGAALDAKFGPAERTALHDAALNGYIDCIRVLLEAGADPNPLNHFGKTPMRYATDPPAPLVRPPNAEVVIQLLSSYGGHP